MANAVAVVEIKLEDALKALIADVENNPDATGMGKRLAEVLLKFEKKRTNQVYFEDKLLFSAKDVCADLKWILTGAGSLAE
jgi:hypothetical protein